MAKGTIVAAKAVKRQKGKMYFVDGSGNVRAVSMNRRGGKKGRHVCATKKKKSPAKKRKATRKRR